MSNKILTILVSISISLGIFSVAYSHLSRPKIGYVKSRELFEGYEGMKEAKARYDQKVGALQANFDTLSRDYQKSLKRYDDEYSRLSVRERTERGALLNSQMQNLEQYKHTVEEQVGKEDESLTQGVYNQVNGYIKQYGDDHGYTIILGTTSNGNILYGPESVDITNKVLEGLNKEYRGKK